MLEILEGIARMLIVVHSKRMGEFHLEHTKKTYAGRTYSTLNHGPSDQVHVSNYISLGNEAQEMEASLAPVFFITSLKSKQVHVKVIGRWLGMSCCQHFNHFIIILKYFGAFPWLKSIGLASCLRAKEDLRNAKPSSGNFELCRSKNFMQPIFHKNGIVSVPW